MNKQIGDKDSAKGQQNQERLARLSKALQKNLKRRKNTGGA